MKIDCLVAEIGSTTTIINAFNIHNKIEFLGKGVSNTTVDSDVNVGLKKAITELKSKLNVKSLEYDEMFASSSAAGGLKVVVTGLVYEMTVKAAKEAALNAGANIHHVTAGVLTSDDVEQIIAIKPNMIIVAGGTDYGDKETAYKNICKIADLNLNIPIIYAGNVDNHYRIQKYFKDHPQLAYLKMVENVYPRVDCLNILPLRKVIYETFEEHIVHAKGMEHIKDMVNGSIMPTPGSVMESTMLANTILGNVMTIDVGGATTDVHSVAFPSEEYKLYNEGEPKEKRTVEGDLGVFINFKNVLSSLDSKQVAKALNISEETLNTMVNDYSYIPKTKQQEDLVYLLTKHCTHKALDRHVGDLKRVFTTNGFKVIPEGKDLSKVQYVIYTGGALINLKNTEIIFSDYQKKNTDKLLPKESVTILKDNDYTMASIGVLSLKYPKQASELLKQTLKI